jgi:hypothetical protein
MGIDEFISLLFEIMFGHKLSKIVELFNIFIFSPESHLFLIVGNQFIEDLLVNYVLPGFIGKVMIQSKVFMQSFIDFLLSHLVFGQ